MVICLTLVLSVDIQVYALFELDMSLRMFSFDYVILLDSLKFDNLIIRHLEINFADYCITFFAIFVHPFTERLAQPCIFFSFSRQVIKGAARTCEGE